MKYSVTCPDFRIIPWIKATLSEVMEGTKKRSTGSITSAVFRAENVPVDIQNIKHIHRSTGPQ